MVCAMSERGQIHGCSTLPKILGVVYHRTHSMEHMVSHEYHQPERRIVDLFEAQQTLRLFINTFLANRNTTTVIDTHQLPVYTERTVVRFSSSR